MEAFDEKTMTLLMATIINQELKNNNLDYILAIGNYKDYCKEVNKHIEISKDRRKALLNQVKDSIAYHSRSSKSIVVFVDKLLKHYKTPEKQLAVGLFSSYHEVRHCIQASFDEYSYEKFLMYMEHYYYLINSYDYKKNHDKYSYEIGANLYAARKTLDIISGLDNDVIRKAVPLIEGLKVKAIDNYYKYDALRIINPVVKHIHDSHSIPNIMVFKVFFNDDGTAKKVSEIMKDENYEKLDKRIVHYMFSSNAFLSQINSKNKDTVGAINDSLSYVETVKTNQLKYVIKNEK